ncbi:MULTISPECIES: hypothetical protein [Sphingobacterium]|uniref:DUF3325 domain-containing protein n=1 Tax=Sphingobacterium multivorum TaxID=28454 RepID=A0A654API6_SPHMU|nr:MULTISPECIES: hypothetical protein [Sphingobacterium]HAL54198.1 hypothetical protein [Sphingobacterium sp.]OFV20116.1 hypothetical protein HMPREF3127_03070 [Sphingobacterium sp. HMSC13C05]QQT43090.1 hypothetical protein I6J00_15115 [Sphingobacterium multivorum]SUI99966.1 Uncharacterised protein [Sphingobacterium multivorum]VXC68886.1 conserved membrane hypothetical protein [Sphingobacterium multivorum]
MYSTLLIVILMGAYLFYNTSKKVKFGPRPQWLEKLCAQTKFVRTLSMLLLIFPFGAVLYLQGFGAGFFAFFAYFMCMMCLVVLLNPYRYFKLYPIMGLYVFSLCVELLIS